MATTSIGTHTSGAASVPYRVSIETAGLFTLVLGAWVAFVPFVGPLFDFSADGTSSWTWSLSHSLLFLVPGAVAFVAALMIIVEGISVGPARHAVLGVAGMIVAVCGAWIVVGPYAWQVLESTNFFVAGGSPLRELAYWIGYSVGPGGLLLALGAFVLGRPRTSWPSTDETWPSDMT
jgi:hypothetical protein